MLRAFVLLSAAADSRLTFSFAGLTDFAVKNHLTAEIFYRRGR